ncbi:MAG: XdhC family protein [Lawsonibacter sp.]|nr:XdhC family protein [Lawsonibacter sp.]
MKRLLSVLEQTLAAGEDVMQVTIIASSGSTPRGSGARMLVSSIGRLAGTIGGGAVEYRCIAMAQERMGSTHPIQSSFQLNQEDNENLGMVCGGRVQVQFLPLSGGDASVIDLCREAAARFAAGTPFWLLTPLQDGEPLSLWPKDGGQEDSIPWEITERLSSEPTIRTAEGRRWFCEQLQQAGVVYLFGGGHMAQALVPVLAPLDFPCVVLEDRSEFSDPHLFPLARETRLIDFSNLLNQVSITRDDYVCIMTRGHQNDLLVQQQVLCTPARYIGLIGSTHKAAIAAELLRKMGFSERDLARIVNPIGLPIGGRSPEEISISIAAQLIQYRSSMRRDVPV